MGNKDKRKIAMKAASERFKMRFTSGPGCWLWNAYTNKRGYGIFYPGGKRVRAHRFSYELWVGKIPEGLNVLHKCDVRNCVRPSHLFLGTNADNSADMVAKGRQVKGGDIISAKLTGGQVSEIRARYACGGVSQRSLGDEFAVSDATICRLINRDTWAHIDLRGSVAA